MQVNVAQLLKEPVGSTRTYQIDEFLNAGSDINEQSAKGEILFIRIEKGIFVKGQISTVRHGTCARCLKPIDYNYKYNIEEEFLPTVDINTGFNLEVEDSTFIIDSHHNIDLSELLYQYASMNKPMKILCNKNCAGICQICGQDLNKGKCKCKSGDYDSRWYKLKNMKKEGKIDGTSS
jgi:uncharacterized protein